MATKFEQLAEKARRAKAARDGGNVDEFLRDVRSGKEVAPAPIPPVSSATSAFAGLVRSTMTAAEVKPQPITEVAPAEVVVDLVVASALEAQLLTTIDPEIARIVSMACEALDATITQVPDALASSGDASDEDQKAAPVLPAVPAPPVPPDVLNDDDSDEIDHGLGAIAVPSHTEPKKTGAPAEESRYARIARLSRERRAISGVNKDGLDKPADVKSTAKPAQDDPAWDCADIPPGSNYSLAEWTKARTPGNTVFEVRNGGQGCLLTLPKRPEGTMQRVLKDKKTGAFTDEFTPATEAQCKGTLNPIFDSAWDGCLLLSPLAVTTHPGAISGELVFRTGQSVFKDVTYRIVRPQSHRETHPWMYGLKGYFQPEALGEPDPQDVEITDADYSPDYPHERDRG